MNHHATGQRLSVHVYSAGSRWVWVVQEFGATLVSGHAPDKATARERGQHARREVGAVMPGGLCAQTSRGKNKLSKGSRV